jgi:RNA polymerase sigma-70 factor (ECF subfamily)
MIHHAVVADALVTHRQFLWDFCYRVTGSAADADTLLHECSAKAPDRPVPGGADRRPHLTRTAATLAAAALRHRKRLKYVGCWLPSPIETGKVTSPAPRPSPATHGPRYDIVESGSMAFLIALEKLQPRERVMLVMCDAFGFAPAEAAAALRVTAAAGRTTLQHARQTMQRYDNRHVAPTRDVQMRTEDVLRECVSHLQAHHAAALGKMFAPDARAWYDSGGEFIAPLAPVSGTTRIARLLLKFAEGMAPMRFTFRMCNGLPAALGVSAGRPRWARRFVFRIEADQDGRVSAVHTITASDKLAALRFDSA